MPSEIKLVVFDLDDTLTVGTTVWEHVHHEMGTWDSHGDPYWEQFKNGRFGYNAFIRKDVACWRGLPVQRLRAAIAKVKFVPGLKSVIGALRRRGIKTALVSSSIEVFAEHVSRKFGIDHVHANTLEVCGGKLTGAIRLNVPGRAKGKLVRRLKRELAAKKRQVLAVGDSAYDLPMFREAGTCVTFRDASPDVKAHAHHIISRNELPKILSFI